MLFKIYFKAMKEDVLNGMTWILSSEFYMILHRECQGTGRKERVIGDNIIDGHILSGFHCIIIEYRLKTCNFFNV